MLDTFVNDKRLSIFSLKSGNGKTLIVAQMALYLVRSKACRIPKVVILVLDSVFRDTYDGILQTICSAAEIDLIEVVEVGNFNRTMVDGDTVVFSDEADAASLSEMLVYDGTKNLCGFVNV